MKKYSIPLMIVAVIAILYSQSESENNLYILLPAIVVFMYEMMQLSAKTPSKNKDNEDENV